MHLYSPNQVSLTYIVALDAFVWRAYIRTGVERYSEYPLCIRKDKETCCEVAPLKGTLMTLELGQAVYLGFRKSFVRMKH